MLKKLLGVLLACAVVLSGVLTAAPAHAEAPRAPAAVKKAQAAKKAEAATKARAAQLTRTLATSWPRAAATARAAAAARARAGEKAAVAARAQLRAVNAAKKAASAKAAAAARTRTAVRANATVRTAQARGTGWKKLYQLRIKAQTARSAATKAKSASRAAASSAKRFASKAATAARASSKAAATANAKAVTARKAHLDHVALAAPRAAAAAAKVKSTAARAKAAARSAATARRAAVASRAALRSTTARARAAATASARARAADTAVRAKKKASAAAKKAARARVKTAAAHASRATAAVRSQTARTTAAQRRLAAATAVSARASATARAAARNARRAKIAAGPNPGWRPGAEVVFNNPKGSKAEQLAIIRELNAAIDATPAGGQIRMAQYLFNINSVATKLIAAHRRGASVQVLVDDGEVRKSVLKVRKVLGTNKRARSFVATCDHSCMSSGKSVIHAKFYLFSVAGKARYVSMISSANPYTGNTFSSWNNSHTIAGNQKIYDSLSQYFTDMLADRDNPNYFRSTRSGKYTVYLYPQAPRRPQDVVLLNALNHTSCRKTAAGFGSKGRTVIRVANWGWTSGRMDVAKRLWQLHDQGCQVQVMINKGRISRPIVKQLLKPSTKSGVMPVYDAWYDDNQNDVAGLYMHHKMLTVDGLVDGRNVKITWTGSQNFTRLATSTNNDIVLRVADAAVTKAYNTNFAYIRAHHTKKMGAVPARTGRILPQQ